ncbi:hypothetical protein HPB51_024362 [Rhipicephalus microplus]|uniref:SGNH hydrolase-type esterase domain-containing protein n=1 Tax=Rhipicephalus microplus TaxID=6941 RepID=A0A9J6D7F1_RHIMP|nr:hypothetical protein HPB51_024362 [Rhipicephalus microplus]
MVRAGNVHVTNVFFFTKVSLQRFRARLAANTMVFFGHVAGKGSDPEGAYPKFWHSHPFLNIVIVFYVYSVQEAATGMGLCKARVLVNEVGFSKFPNNNRPSFVCWFDDEIFAVAQQIQMSISVGVWGPLPSDYPTKKIPIHGAATAIVGDSQLKYLHQHFDPASPHSRAFICQPGACIGDIGELLDFVPKGTSNLILHIGTNDLANTDAPTAFNRYVALLDRIRHEKPDIPTVFATLVLPRAPNQRLRRHNWRAVRWFNFEAREFNLRLLSLCHEREGVFYVNHRIDALPPWTVLAADGLHPSFAGVSLLAWNIYNLLLDLRRSCINNWLEHAPQPEAGAYELRETPSYSQALRRDSSDATCRGGKEKNMNPAAPETVAARSPGQHTPSRPPSPSAQLPSRLPRLSSTPTTHTTETVTKGNPGQQQRPAVPKSTATSGQSKPPARKNQQPTSSTNKQQPQAANSRRLQASSSQEAQRDGAPTQTRYDLRAPCGPIRRVCAK